MEHIPVTSVLKRLRQEDHWELETSLYCRLRSCLNKTIAPPTHHPNVYGVQLETSVWTHGMVVHRSQCELYPMRGYFSVLLCMPSSALQPAVLAVFMLTTSIGTHIPRVSLLCQLPRWPVGTCYRLNMYRLRSVQMRLEHPGLCCRFSQHREKGNCQLTGPSAEAGGKSIAWTNSECSDAG